jgi:hypothetical protein
MEFNNILNINSFCQTKSEKKTYKRVIKTIYHRYNNRIKNNLPMKYFTKEENKPSKNTLNIIKQIAYTYRSIKLNGKNEAYCLN